MKKTILLFTSLIILVACDDNSGNKLPFSLDTRLVLNGSEATRIEVPEAPYSIETIVRHTWEMGFHIVENGVTAPRWRAVSTHDIKNNKLRIGQMDDIIEIDNKTGEPALGYFIYNDVHDIVLLVAYHEDESKGWIDAYLSDDMGEGYPFSNKRDTIGYAPNIETRETQDAVRVAFAQKDWTECKRLFEQSYKFRPITGAGYRELQAQGKN